MKKCSHVGEIGLEFILVGRFWLDDKWEQKFQVFQEMNKVTHNFQ